MNHSLSKIFNVRRKLVDASNHSHEELDLGDEAVELACQEFDLTLKIEHAGEDWRVLPVLPSSKCHIVVFGLERCAVPFLLLVRGGNIRRLRFVRDC